MDLLKTLFHILLHFVAIIIMILAIYILYKKLTKKSSAVVVLAI